MTTVPLAPNHIKRDASQTGCVIIGKIFKRFVGCVRERKKIKKKEKKIKQQQRR